MIAPIAAGAVEKYVERDPLSVGGFAVPPMAPRCCDLEALEDLPIPERFEPPVVARFCALVFDLAIRTTRSLQMQRLLWL